MKNGRMSLIFLTREYQVKAKTRDALFGHEGSMFDRPLCVENRITTSDLIRRLARGALFQGRTDGIYQTVVFGFFYRDVILFVVRSIRSVRKSGWKILLTRSQVGEQGAHPMLCYRDAGL
jgi:hypothetical protein